MAHLMSEQLPKHLPVLSGCHLEERAAHLLGEDGGDAVSLAAQRLAVGGPPSTLTLRFPCALGRLLRQPRILLLPVAALRKVRVLVLF